MFDSKATKHLKRFSPFLAAFLIYTLLAWFVVVPELHLAGDEPHYLLITHSLCYDHDFDLANNYANKDFLAFFPWAALASHAFDYHNNGKHYSIHNIGVPLLLVPAYCILRPLGLPTIRLTMILLAALTSYHIFQLARDLWQREKLAWCAWGIAVLTVPFFWFSSQVYPDLPGALLLVIAARQLLKRSALAMVSLGVIIAVFPWLHTRYLVFSAILFGFALIYRPKNKPIRDWLIPLCGPALISGGVFIMAYMTWYGNPLTNAQYKVTTFKALSLDAFLAYGLNFFLDREFGLIPYAPVFLLAFSGLVTGLIKREKFLINNLLIIIILYYAVIVFAAVTFIGFGGYAFPGRLLIPILPFFIIFIVYWAAQHRLAWYITLIMLALSAGISLMASVHPPSLYNDYDGLMEIPYWRGIQRVFPGAGMSPKRWLAAHLALSNTGHLVTEPRLAETEARVIYATPDRDQPEFIAYALRSGAYTGYYRLHYELKFAPTQTTEPLVRLMASTDNFATILATQDLYAADVSFAEDYQQYPLTFMVEGYKELEAQVYYTGQSDLWVHSVTFERISPAMELSGPVLKTIYAIIAIALGLVTVIVPGQSSRSVVGYDSAG